MNKKNSKYLAVLAAMLMFSILLASCQSILASAKETDIKQAEEDWGANLTLPGESYFKIYLEEMGQASVPWVELRSDVPIEAEKMQQASVPWVELRSDVPAPAIASKEEMERERALEAWGMNLTARGERFLEEMERSSVPWVELRSDVPAPAIASKEEMEKERAIEAWGANLTAQGERYLEEMQQASVPWVELRSDVPSEEMEQTSAPLLGESYFESYLEEMERAGVPIYELKADDSTEAAVMVDASSPGIEIQRTWLESRSFLTVYTVTSDRPAWVVFHTDEDGLPGTIHQNILVGSGTQKIARVEDVAEIGLNQIHVMLHYDFGMSSLFEFPGPDGPVYVDDEIVNALCFCPF